jgi:hypothetical protein
MTAQALCSRSYGRGCPGCFSRFPEKVYAGNEQHHGHCRPEHPAPRNTSVPAAFRFDPAPKPLGSINDRAEVPRQFCFQFRHHSSVPGGAPESYALGLILMPQFQRNIAKHLQYLHTKELVSIAKRLLCADPGEDSRRRTEPVRSFPNERSYRERSHWAISKRRKKPRSQGSTGAFFASDRNRHSRPDGKARYRNGNRPEMPQSRRRASGTFPARCPARFRDRRYSAARWYRFCPSNDRKAREKRQNRPFGTPQSALFRFLRVPSAVMRRLPEMVSSVYFSGATSRRSPRPQPAASPSQNEATQPVEEAGAPRDRT